MTISKEMSIGQVVQEHPETIAVFLQHGLGCVGCAAAHFENIEQGAKAHGIDINALIQALNAAVSEPAAM
jgi:hybrid cluster-associated redox disulfide protein